MISFAQIALGTDGELCCALCGRQQAAVPRPARSVAQAVASVVDTWSDGPGPNVAFVGFEPFAHPELPSIVGDAVAGGVRRLRLRTDGGALAQPGNADGVVGAGVRQFELQMLAGTAAASDEITARPGLFAAATTGASQLHAAAERAGVRIALTGRVVLCPHNLEHAAASVAHLCSLRALAVELVVPDSEHSAHPAVAAALDTATVNGVAAFVSGAASASGATSASGVYGVAPWRVGREVW